MLDAEIEQLAGQRHARKAEATEATYRHGTNPRSVRLGGQRHPIRVRRVRGPEGEIRLEAYDLLHASAGEIDEGLFCKVTTDVLKSVNAPGRAAMRPRRPMEKLQPRAALARRRAHRHRTTAAKAPGLPPPRQASCHHPERPRHLSRKRSSLLRLGG